MKTNDKVKNILDSIKKAQSENSSPPVDTVKSDERSKKKNLKKIVEDAPRGKPKSGRIWKNTKQKFSSIKKAKGAHQTFKEKETLRQQLKETKEASKAILAQRKEAKEAHKQRRRENLKKAEENRLKSEIVQVISNPAKLKRMKKKQLRFIEKRDTIKKT